MKKQLRLVLFAVLVMVLIMASALVASAVTEGATVQENGHYYSVHTGPRDRQPKYYSTLENAIASIQADGYTITVLQKATEQGVTLDADYAYTIKSKDGARVTLNFIAANDDGSLVNITKGKVTFSGVNFAYAASQMSAPDCVINVNGASEVVFNNVKSTADADYTVLGSAAAVITVSGDDTDVSGATNFYKAVVAGTTLNVTGGKLGANAHVILASSVPVTVNVTGGEINATGGAAFRFASQTGSVVTVSGGVLKASAGQNVFSFTRTQEGTTTISLQQGAKILANNTVVFGSMNNDYYTVDLNGAEFYLQGASAALFTDAELAFTVNTTAATVYLQNGAAYPAAGWATKLDYSKIAVGITELTLTTGTLTLNSADDLATLIAANVPAHITKLVPGWIPVVIDGADAVLNVADGVYEATDTALFIVKNGTLNLQGGTLKGAADNAIVVLEGGTVNYTGTTMTAGADGTTFEVLGGTLSVEGTSVRLPEHKYSVVAAQGEAPKYYTTMAAALDTIAADGAVITVLDGAGLEAWVLDIDYAYTIKGNGTATFTSMVSAGKKALINVTAGKPTLEGLTFAYTGIAPDSVAALSSDEAELIVNNIVVNMTFDTVFYVNAETKLTITGANTAINNGANGSYIVNLNVADSEVLIENGTLTSGGSLVYFAKGATATVTGGDLTALKDVAFKSARRATPVVVSIANASVTSGAASPLIKGGNGVAFDISLLEGAKITVNDAEVFSPANASTVTWSGAVITLTGADAVLANVGDLEDIAFTITSGGVVLANGAAVPAVELDAVIPWDKVDIAFTEYEATYEITEGGVYVFNNLEEYLEIAQAGALAAFATEFKTRFPRAELTLAGWIPLTINHPDAAVTVVSGDYVTPGSYFFTVKAGTLNIRNAVFTAVTGSVVVMEGGTLNVIAGNMIGPDAGKVIEHKAGVINVTGGTLTAGLARDSYIIYSTAQIGNDINISGGTLLGGTVIYVDESASASVNITNGVIDKRDGAAGVNGIMLYSESAVLNISGGEIKNMNVVIHATKGAVNISGGTLKNDANGSHILNVDGPVKVNITGGDLILMTVLDNIGAINITTNAAAAEVDISGGNFGGTDGAGRNYMNPINVAAPIQHFNVTGGTFVGGRSGGGVVVRATAEGAVLNFSGDCLVGAYRAFYLLAPCTLNIAGGTYTKRPYSDQQNYITFHATKEVTINVSGGHFTEIMIGFYMAGGGSVNITGGVFDTRTLHENSGEGVYALARITSAAKITVGPNTTGGLDPVFNLKRSATKNGATIQDLLGFYITNSGAELRIGAGTYNIENANNIWFNFPADGLAAFEVTGGTFSVVGEGASFVPASMDKPGTLISGATVKISGGAGLPVYDNIDTTTLHIIFEGAITDNLIIRKPFSGDDPDGNGYVLSTPADLYNLVAGQFASFRADASAFATWLPMLIDGEGVIVTFKDVNDVYDMPTMVTVKTGTLKVSGGTYVANAGEKLFNITGSGATLAISGGDFTVSGVGSYLIAIADGITPTISVENAKMTVGMLGSAPLQADFSVTAQQVTVTGMSEILLSAPGTYTIAAVSDITEMVRAALAEKFTTGLTVNIETWVPLHLNNAGLSVTVTGGDYMASAPFMFKVTAGTLTITGGKFTNDAGDIIHVTGKDAVVLINLPNTGAEDPNGMYTTGRIIYSVGAADATKAASITVQNGRFVELAYDASNNQKDALFVLDGVNGGASGTEELAVIPFVIENGYFEATRVLLIYYAAADATIGNGTFVSNVVIDGTVITARPTNAHMLSPRGEGATLTVNGGSFDNKQGNYVFALNGDLGATVTVTGGTFNGGGGWFIAPYDTTLTITGGTFTDTEGYANNHYMYLNNAATKVTISGGTFTGTVGTSDIFHVAGGTLNILDGSFTGSLFYVTTDAKITVAGGSYKATGIGSVLFEFVGAVTNTNFGLTVNKQFAAENYASIISVDTLTTSEVKTLLAKATYALDGSLRLGVTVPVGANETWNTPADAKHFITDFFGSANVTFGPNAGVYALQLSGNKTITIKGGAYLFPGATLFKLYGGLNLVIEDGTFYASEGGDIFYLEGDSDITIGQEYDATVQPKFVVGFGGNIIDAYQPTGAVFTIYNGSFYKGILNDDGSVTPVIDYVNYTSPLFYFHGGEEDGSSHVQLIICDGYYEATRVLMDYYAYGSTTIYGGVFKSNFDKANIAATYGDVEYDSKNGPVIKADDGCMLYDCDQNYLLNVRGNGASLTIYGGVFNGAYSRAIIGLAGQGGTTFNFYGGDFTGGFNWFYCNYGVTVNMGEKQNPWTEVVSSPTFRAPDNFTRYGFYFDVNAEGKHIDLNISGGSYSMLGYYDRYMFVLKGDIDVNVTGGSFVVNPGTRTNAYGELQNDTMIFTSYATGTDLWADITISGGSFTAARIVFISKGRAHLVITGGTFTSNSQSVENAHFFYLNYASSTIYISGGTFTGNKYQYHHFYATGSSGLEITIVGGTFSKGLRWGYLSSAGMKFTVDKTATTAPVFNDLSDGTGVDKDNSTGKTANVTVYGIYIHRNCSGATISFDNATFKLPVTTYCTAMFVVEGGNMTFGKGMDVEHPSRIFQITNAFIGNITFTGGTYTSTDVCNMFYITVTMANATKNGGLAEARILIEDGTFNAMENSTMFHLLSQVPQYEILIKGGTFYSENARMFFYDGTGMTVNIEGGDFSSTAARLVYLDNNTTPLYIKGGTFTFLPKSGNNTDNGLIYAVGKNPSVVNISGGTFIDQRVGNKQTFIKMNPKAVINFVGDFRMYVLEKKDNFFYDYDNNSNSLPITKYASVETLDGEDYYVCFGYYREYGPNMTSTPALRAVLGQEGITYKATISAATLEYLQGLGTVTYGMLIFPTEYLNDGEWNNDTDFLADLKAYAQESGKAESSVYVDIVADKGKTVDADGNVTYYASLINIKEANYTRAMTGIAYIKVVDAQGEVKYHYATHVSASVTQDMRTLAKASLFDLDTKPWDNNGRVYCYATIMKEGMYFSRYSPVQQDSLRKYLAESDRMPKHKR